jgi:hypothetical protein
VAIVEAARDHVSVLGLDLAVAVPLMHRIDTQKPGRPCGFGFLRSPIPAAAAFVFSNTVRRRR